MALEDIDEFVKELAIKQFNQSAEKYVSSKIHSSKEDLAFVKNFINPKSNWTILDIATGTGHLALSLASHVKQVIASDISDKMLEQGIKIAKERNIKNFNAQLFDVHNIPYENDFFDLVTSRIAPHHFHDINVAIREMVRVLKKGGFIFIEDTISPIDDEAAEFFNYIERLRDPSHVRTLCIEKWVEILEKNDSKVIKVDKKIKKWPLRWWMDRMNTSKKNRKEILNLLSLNHMKYQNTINIVKNDQIDDEEDMWTIFPFNGYTLAYKK